jgi:hypothetical protein
MYLIYCIIFQICLDKAPCRLSWLEGKHAGPLHGSAVPMRPLRGGAVGDCAWQCLARLPILACRGHLVCRGAMRCVLFVCFVVLFCCLFVVLLMRVVCLFCCFVLLLVCCFVFENIEAIVEEIVADAAAEFWAKWRSWPRGWIRRCRRTAARLDPPTRTPPPVRPPPQ